MARSDTTSLKSAILNYKYRNGRRYHAYKEGSYCALPHMSDDTGAVAKRAQGGPNDEMSADQMDI